MTIHPHDWSARCLGWWRYSVPEAETGELDKLWVISKYHFQFFLMIFISLFGIYPFPFFPRTYFLVLISLGVQHEASSFDTCHFDNGAGQKQVVLLDARSHLSPSWQPLLRWVYLQAQLLSSPKLRVWNKNAVGDYEWNDIKQDTHKRQTTHTHSGRRNRTGQKTNCRLL